MIATYSDGEKQQLSMKRWRSLTKIHEPNSDDFKSTYKIDFNHYLDIG